MKVFVAMVGVNYEGGEPIGVYDSAESALAALREYANRVESKPYMSDYFEVYEYELNKVLDIVSSSQQHLYHEDFWKLVDGAEY